MEPDQTAQLLEGVRDLQNTLQLDSILKKNSNSLPHRQENLPPHSRGIIVQEEKHREKMPERPVVSGTMLKTFPTLKNRTRKPISFQFQGDDISSNITDSGHDSTSTFETGTHSDSTGTGFTLGQLPRNKDYNQPIEILPQLPSHKFKHSVWYDLRQTTLTGDSLHAPRVRKGPPEVEKEFYKLRQEGLPIHHERKGRARQNYQDTQENWEDAKAINLSYQELMDEFQKKNFLRVLQRCKSAVTVNIVNNCTDNLSSVSFPSCEFLNFNNNFIKSFNHFPSVPKVKSLTAVFNAVKTFDGLNKLSSSPIQELNLQGNPISFMINYRQKVFAAIPNLQVLDGIPRMPSDSVFQEEEEPPYTDGGSCAIL